VATFVAAGQTHGWPASTLTDNAAVYTPMSSEHAFGAASPSWLSSTPGVT
jgi:hypothetical protein